jgi:hypothetical protein
VTRNQEKEARVNDVNKIIADQLSNMNTNIINMTGEIGGLKSATESQGREIRDLKVHTQTISGEISTLTSRISSNDDNTGFIRQELQEVKDNCAAKHGSASGQPGSPSKLDSIPPAALSTLRYVKRFGMPGTIFMLVALLIYLLTNGKINLFTP